MNAHVLSDAQAIQRRNDQKATTRTCRSPKESGIESIFLTQGKPELPEPILVKLTSNQLLQVLGIPIWGVGNIPCDIHRWIENDEDVASIIHTARHGYAQKVQMA
jgi:hypothetical protein